jgi:hypothetical protein
MPPQTPGHLTNLKLPPKCRHLARQVHAPLSEDQ